LGVLGDMERTGVVYELSQNMNWLVGCALAC